MISSKNADKSVCKRGIISLARNQTVCALVFQVAELIVYIKKDEGLVIQGHKAYIHDDQLFLLEVREMIV